ncbi:GNAT family N-acetyltransferase [Aureimonas mangrovi]|uniref:GNAT family N-acetyltransferase n=1 Tax=Aureimonas mangrovi TaxID=2758041 RepID=UPI00163DDB8B|nr:GNAT family N-acetyltransferase [Aureimonas mangrovi]
MTGDRSRCDEDWRWSRFGDLSGREVHDLLKLRVEVFVVEQACAFAEIDGLDIEALHLRVLCEHTLAGCLRILADDDGAPRIGRIVTSPSARGSGLGHRMMEAAVARCTELHPGEAIVLSAQAHLQNFYAAHGFIPASGAYLEDGIAHVDMRRPA